MNESESLLVPLAAVARMPPMTMRRVVPTMAVFLPIRSHTRPTTTWPMISPTSRAFDTRVDTDEVYWVG